MSSTGERPKTGLRVTLVRDAGDEPPFRYRGTVEDGDTTRPVTVVVAGDGAVEAAVGGDPPDAGLQERVRLFVRSALPRGRAEDGRPPPPPRKIARWRGEK